MTDELRLKRRERERESDDFGIGGWAWRGFDFYRFWRAVATVGMAEIS